MIHGNYIIKIRMILFLYVALSITVSAQTKLFTKYTNKWVEMDKRGNQISAVSRSNIKFEIYYSTSGSYGHILTTNLDNGEKWKMNLNSMYTAYAKGIKVYYFQSSDGSSKISCTSSEQGVAIYTYSDQVLTNFYYE